jgi:GTPase
MPEPSAPESVPAPHRSGFACLVGRPNAGKSTLLNAMVGSKIAITSTRPQTTRHTIRGVVNRPAAQLVLIDTPGMHKPRTLLGERLTDAVRSTWSLVDAVVLCLPADAAIGPGDRRIAAELARLRRTPVLITVTKTDLVSPEEVAERLAAAGRLLEAAEIVPTSSPTGFQVELLVDLISAQLPPGPSLYPDGELTDAPEETLVAELIREAALDGIWDELPHSLAVTIAEMAPREGRPADRPLLDVYATLHVERSSQKGILIGAGASRLRVIGARAREQIEALLGTQVYLDLHVTVAKDWQRDPAQLRRLGF